MKWWYVTGLLLLCSAASAQTQPTRIVVFPHIQVDVRHRQVRIECESLQCDAPLEMLCCVAGTHDYESLLRSGARPSQVHMGLLMIGLKPGEPAHYVPALKRWVPPTGDAMNIEAQFTEHGKTVRMNACDLMRNIKTHKPMPHHPWIFAGSRVINGTYTADVNGYLITVVNFDWSVIDIPAVASNSNATLQWERNPATAPPAGAIVTLIISPVQGASTRMSK